jgi:pyruvate dehydrogenase E2 component (dihydrolipoamide acetyltransferase)
LAASDKTNTMNDRDKDSEIGAPETGDQKIRNPETAEPEPRGREAAGSAPARRGQGGAVTVDRSPATSASPAITPLPAGEVQRIPVSGMRAAIARRMHQSQREVPLFHAEHLIRMDPALALCARLRREGHQISLTHILLKAAADSVHAQLEVNARFVGDAIEILRRIHIAIATGLPEGLVFPVLHDAPGLNLLQIAERTATLRAKAEEKTLTTEELSGATFTVSNLGTEGVDRLTTVVQPPQAASLSLGAVKPRPIAENGELAVASTLHATLSCDHRAVDGQQAAAYLKDLARRLEDPEQLLTGIRLGDV